MAKETGFMNAGNCQGMMMVFVFGAFSYINMVCQLTDRAIISQSIKLPRDITCKQLKNYKTTMTSSPMPLKTRYVLYLIESGRLKKSDLKRAETFRDQNGGDLITLLVRLGLVSERDVAEAESSLLDLPLISTADLPDEAPDIGKLSLRYLKQNLLLPVSVTDTDMVVVMANPRDEYALKALAMASGKTICPQVGVASEIENGIEKLYGVGRSAMGQIIDTLGDEDDDLEDVEHLRDLASEAPVIRLVNLIMQRAVEARASDIHIEPFENRLKVRYRIDGVLQEVEAPPASSTAAVISRVKIMARLNIAERRLPQDGRIMHRVQGKELDLRVSTIPTSHGESVVMRILDRESIVLDFDSLGFDEGLKKTLSRTWRCRMALSSSPAQPVRVKRQPFIRHSARSTPRQEKSSRSKIRWNISLRVSTRSRHSHPSVWILHMP